MMDLSHNPVYKKTKTYSYMYPMIHSEVPKGFFNHLVNVFLGDIEYPALDNHLFLLYRFSGSIDFADFENSFENSPLFVQSYDPDKFHVMKVFAMSKDLQDDYDTFTKSLYSKLSDSYKQKIVNHWAILKTHLLYGVLYKKEFAFEEAESMINLGLDKGLIHIDRNQEASSILDRGRENYNPSLMVHDALREASEEIWKKNDL